MDTAISAVAAIIAQVATLRRKCVTPCARGMPGGSGRIAMGVLIDLAETRPTVAGPVEFPGDLSDGKRAGRCETEGQCKG